MTGTANMARLQEKIELLDGSRAGGNIDQAAVRVSDVAELLRLATIKTQRVSAAPTANDFNSLLGDIQEIHNRLHAISLILQRRLRR